MPQWKEVHPPVDFQLRGFFVHFSVYGEFIFQEAFYDAPYQLPSASFWVVVVAFSYSSKQDNTISMETSTFELHTSNLKIKIHHRISEELRYIRRIRKMNLMSGVYDAHIA